MELAGGLVSEVVIVQAVATSGSVLVALIGVGIPAWLKLRRVARDTQATREQTENNHEGHEFSNLREHLDAIHEDVREAKAAAGRAEDSAHRAEGWAHAAAESNHETDRRLSKHLVESAPLMAWARKHMSS